MNVYRNTEGPYTKNDFEIKIKINHPQITEFETFRHCNLPIMGIGPNGSNNPFMYFDHLLDLSDLEKIKNEVLEADINNLIQFNKIVANGLVAEDVNQQKCVESYMAHLNKYAKSNDWVELIKNIQRKGDIKVFFHNYFKIKTAWEGIAMFRKYEAIYQKKTEPSEWLPFISHFPILKKFVESLPFNYVGYVMIFKSNAQHPVLIHRDYYPTNHTVNFINFKLDHRPRPFFLYDMNSKKKSYINSDYRSYFFNEIDPHGMDAEAYSGLTLRVEGQFQQSFKDQIGLNYSDTFNWQYDHCQNFLSSNNFKITQSTDL